MKTVFELSRDELNELKEAYADQLKPDGISVGELLDANNMPDSVIFNHYCEVMFSEDDFFCNT